jgi:putative CocE/NonD family hydrolase
MTQSQGDAGSMWSMRFGFDSPPPLYDRDIEFDDIVWDRDIMIPTRDNVQLCGDVYRPPSEGSWPALLAYAPHNKDLQTPTITEGAPAMGAQPAWSSWWMGAQEAGDTRFFVGRGYVHVIVNPRGFGKSDDGPKDSDWLGKETDLYDVIEWIAAQPWCDGNVGMIGISAYGGSQYMAARMKPPSLKAIFPFDPCSVYGEPVTGFRGAYPGAVLHPFFYLLDQLGVPHFERSRPPLELDALTEARWQEAMENRDYRMYLTMYNLLTQRGQHSPYMFQMLLNPFDTEESVVASEAQFDQVDIPMYTGSGWYSYTYKAHLQGCQDLFTKIKSPKKLLLTGPAHLERPWHSFHSEVLRWYDYWLKGIDTGVMDEPAVKYWLMGANEWRTGNDWPLPETKWTKFYLNSWERLRLEPPAPMSRDYAEEPDAFVQMPPTQTREVARLRYMTDPLPRDVQIAGPSALYLSASIDQNDTNWIIALKDVGPDVSVRTAREGETEVRTDLPERELVRGWLKASHRALDEERSVPWL